VQVGEKMEMLLAIISRLLKVQGDRKPRDREWLLRRETEGMMFNFWNVVVPQYVTFINVSSII